MRATLSRRFPSLCALALMPVLLACALSLAACSGRPDTLQEIQDRGALYIGLDPSYPPFEALAPDGELYGLDVDLGSELAQRLGVESHFVLVGYDGLYDALLVRQVDVLISALVVEPGRMDDVAYSIVYFDAGLALVAPADGKTLAEFRLDAPPVFDGMAAAGGRLYMATVDGEVLCFGPNK